MVGHQLSQKLNQTTQQTLTGRLLQPLLNKRRPQRVLLLRHALAADIIVDVGASTEVVSISSEECASGAQIHARLSALPFEDATFDLVVLQHLISDGNEAVLAEAIRVLAPGGDIIISGLNHAGLRYHTSRDCKPFPAIKINRVTVHLKSNSFMLTRSLRAGFAGMAWPQVATGWLGSSLPFFDRVALQAHHHSGNHVMRLSSLEKVRTTSVASAALDAFSHRKSL